MPFSIHDRLQSFRYAINGIRVFLAGTHNAWIQLSIASLVILAGLLFRITCSEWIAVSVCIGFVLAIEATNTAVEKLCDRLHPETDKEIGLVKDIAAGAVLIAAFFSAIVGLIIFIPKLINLFK
jgi:diacylglycerol kinase (ATP)